MPLDSAGIEGHYCLLLFFNCGNEGVEIYQALLDMIVEQIAAQRAGSCTSASRRLVSTSRRYDNCWGIKCCAATMLSSSW